MIYKIFPSRDTAITNFRLRNIPQTGSNLGASEILEVYKKTLNGSAASGSISHVLMYFDHSVIGAMTASGEMPRSGMRHYLNVFDAQHDDTLPSSFDLEIVPVSQDWDEGNGLDSDTYTDKGYANWVMAKSNSWWTTAGGSVSPIFTGSVHFDSGHENIKLDVTSLVDAWLTGTQQNFGLMIRLSSSLESNSLDYYTKKFHSRHSNFLARRPFIESKWDDSVKDDRSNFVYDYTNSLFLYNKVRGELVDIPSVGTSRLYVKITDNAGEVLTYVTASHTGQAGTYSASLSISTGSYDLPLHDVWFSGTKWFMTGTFYPTDDFAQERDSNEKLYVSVPGLKDRYTTDEVVKVRVYSRPWDYNPAVVLTGTSETTPNVLTKAYYGLLEDTTESVVVPFGTGTLESTRLSYDERGNWFKFYMSALPPGNIYRLVFLIVKDGVSQYYDGDFKFQVV